MTLCCITLGVGVVVGNRVQRQRMLLDYLHSKYGNRPWAGAKYDHEPEIGELHYRPFVEDLFHRIVEVQCFQTFEHFDETALKLSAVPSLEVLKIDESNLTDVGITHLCRLKHLRLLEIPDSDISDQSLIGLASMQSLKRLDITNASDVTREAVLRFRQQRPDIELIENAD